MKNSIRNIAFGLLFIATNSLAIDSNIVWTACLKQHRDAFNVLKKYKQEIEVKSSGVSIFDSRTLYNHHFASKAAQDAYDEYKKAFEALRFNSFVMTSSSGYFIGTFTGLFDELFIAVNHYGFIKMPNYLAVYIFSIMMILLRANADMQKLVQPEPYFDPETLCEHENYFSIDQSDTKNRFFSMILTATVGYLGSQVALKKFLKLIRESNNSIMFLNYVGGW